MRIAAEFNAGRLKLLEKWESEEEWRAFAALCVRLEREWKQYQEKGLGEFERAAEMKTHEMNFKAVNEFSNEVLSEWSSVAILIGK